MHKFIVITLFAAILTPSAFATYIDPGSGQFILQMLGVAFFGSLFYIKRIWGWFRALFNKSSAKESVGESDKKKAA